MRVGLPDLPALMIFALGLFQGTLSDLREKSVPDLVWWICLGAGCVLMTQRSLRGVFSPEASGLLCMTAVFLIQEGIMGRSYGRADCHAFCACELIFFSLGYDLRAHILQLVLSLGLLLCIQHARRNITAAGRLKKPVPFLPYITASFLLSLLLAPYPQ